MKKLSIFILSAGLFLSAQAQKKGHKITFEVPQMAGKELFLAYHSGNKQYISDTLVFDSKGKTVAEGEELLKNGVYLAVFPSMKNKYFEFLVKEQFFTVMLPDTNNLGKPQFKDSKENDLFYSDMAKMGELRVKADAMNKQIKASEGAQKEKLEKELNKISDDFAAAREKLMTDNPTMFYIDILGLMREIEIPDELTKGEDRNAAFQYFRKHYWDFTDFSEEGIIRTPVFHGKLIDFFDKYTVRTQDSLIKSCDIVLEKAAANPDVFQYCLVTLVNKYANSKVMGDDAVYVHLIKEYYGKGKAWWTDEEQLNKLLERANALEPILIGKISPDLALLDTTAQKVNRLHAISKDFTIVFIWDPECGHCKKATPVLKEFYDDFKNQSIEVYAISTVNINELQAWKDFIKKYDLNWLNVADLYHQTKFRDLYDISSTPQVFILDKDKRIIAKRLGVEQIEGFFHNYLKSKEDPRADNFKAPNPNEELKEEH